ncbi:MAG: lipopolysaccharide biosynthesis protein [Steroidobacteraceae bacterium]
MSIRTLMARGALWMVLFKALDRSLGFVSTLILARLLVPADFGLVAMATSLIAFLELLTYFGLDTALLRDQETTRAHFDVVWTLNVLAGGLIALLMVTLSIPAAHFYHEPRVTPVICALSLGSLIQGFENVGVVNFRKEMRFDREFRYMFSRRLVAFATTVTLAITLRNYWALVCGMLAGRVSGVGLSFILQPFRPRLSLRSLGDLLHFSKWLMLQNVISFLKTRSSDFVVGRMSGSSALGIFSVAAEISNMPGTELVAPINRAILPAYMNIAKDLPALRREFLSVMSIVALLAVPAVAGFAVCAPFMVLVLLGPKWVHAADIIEILAFYGITQVMQSNAYSAFLALGKPQVFVWITSIHVAILVPLLIALTSAHGLNGAAWAYVVSSVVIMPVDFYFITRYMGLPPLAYISRLWRPLCGATFMYLGVRAFGPPSPGAAPIPTLQAAHGLVTCILIGAPLYVGSMGVLWLASGRPSQTAESWVLSSTKSAWKSALPLLSRRILRMLGTLRS